MTDATIATIGDNLPPPDADPLRERLAEDHAALISRATELLEAVDRVPETVTEATAGRVSDFIKQLTGHIKALDTTRVAEKEPYLAGGRNVDGFFKAVTDPLGKAKTVVQVRLTAYLREKAEAERRAREEEARRQAEEEARLRAEAEAKAAELASESDLDDAVAAEERARQAKADRLKAEQDAKAKAAELSRTRGDYGSVGSLRTFWDFEVLYIHEIPLEEIRAHLPIAAVEQAIRSYVKAGGRDLKGVRIFENTAARVS
jgi:hypothetical protein